jgi:protein-S-isoprenylcysteine O-methyltransferase Ste14
MTTKSEPNNLDHADVRIPPPLIYVAVFLLGLVLKRFFPVFVLPKIPSRAVTVLCIALGITMALWSVGLFRRERTSFVPIKPTTTLVIYGPYHFTRNPMYLGLVCVYAGLALWFGVFWALILLPAVMVLIQQYVIMLEEPTRHSFRVLGQHYQSVI